MSEGFDEELERIKLRKIREMLGKEGEEGGLTRGEPITLTDENFKSVISSNRLVLVDFWAPWCAPCRIIAPIIEELASQYSGRVVFGKLNVDENTRTAMDFMVAAIPTLILFKNGVEVERLVGAMPKQAIESVLQKHL
ncbi:MAG: thioredoxin [Candidatus Hecatellales archaeon]|nr:MAG: thioredoxin [Candidatus Hecatellales archaeon]